MTGTPTADRRVFLKGVAGLGASAFLAGCAPKLGGMLTAADAHPENYPTVQAVRYMGDLLSQWTGGRLGIKIFAGGQLGSETDTLEITSFGGLDLTRVNFAPLNSIEPTTLPVCLPFIFNSVAHMRKVVDSDVGEEILASLEPHGLIGLCYYDSGARSFYNKRNPIRHPRDMAGLKLRVPPSDLYVAMINALGANAVPIPFGEIYQALTQGVIDGAENNWPTLVGERHYEAVSYFSLTEHLFTPEALVMSKASWDNLADDDRSLVRRAAKRSVVEMRRLWDLRVAEAKRVIAASDVKVNTVDKAPFAELMRPVWDRFIVTPTQKSLVDRIVAMGQG
ncbi:TRAP transporter substrate-binding protein [Erythrobacter sp. LQ02-29]|uniref:TRAP transporter substrate-binding protein n=1 Tax=Erythrobacter sp. LQ02-29 TaxID=2920384 RepID=UPI001F4EC64E|nr:TRAP transporter substrate-binding protein [Erythrobacter sp. LQ02-29]MCP9221210.1 TRAP transporter substrate-binding protein [Erythrobacter sp. LQ02-29]